MQFSKNHQKVIPSICFVMFFSTCLNAQTYPTTGIDISKGLYSIELENENLNFNDSIKSSSKILSFHISTGEQDQIGIVKRSLLSASPNTKNYADLFDELNSSNSRKISALSKNNFLRYFYYVSRTDESLFKHLKLLIALQNSNPPAQQNKIIEEEFNRSWAKLAEIPFKYYSPNELNEELLKYPFLKILISKNRPVLPCGSFSFSWTDSMIGCQDSESSKALDGSFSKNGVVVLRMYSFKPELMEWVHDKENNIIWGPEQSYYFLKSLPESYKRYSEHLDAKGQVIKAFNPRRTARDYCSSLNIFGLDWELAYSAQYSSADLKNKLRYAWLPGFTNFFDEKFSKDHQIPEYLALDNTEKDILKRDLSLTDIRNLKLKEYSDFGFRCTAKPNQASQEKLDSFRTNPPILP
ncbi:MAG: hypothetical protein KA116_00180 [Proteobacteria bacterium]|nr:hypothetical protein [Pseudomonadota bacterium]